MLSNNVAFLISADLDESVLPAFKLETPNDVQSVA